MINSELIRRLNEQRVTLRAQLAEQSSTLLDNHPRIKELKAQIADLDRQIRDEAAAACALARERRAHRRRAASSRCRAASTSSSSRRPRPTGRMCELRALEREAKAQRDLLESYLAKYRETTARDSLGVRADRRAHHLARARVEHPVFPEEAADRADRDARDAVHLGGLYHHGRASRRQRLPRRHAGRATG